MIEIPLGKALVPVRGSKCSMCFFYPDKVAGEKALSFCRDFDCADYDREDGTNVIFKLVDWPLKEIPDNARD